MPLSWQEIYSYNSITHSNLDSWEALQIRKMSELYCSYLTKGKSISCPPPYQGMDDLFGDEDKLDVMRNNVNNQWKRLKAARKAAKKQTSQSTSNIKLGDAPML